MHLYFQQWRNYLWGFFLLTFLLSLNIAYGSVKAPYNDVVLEAVNMMPSGGGYGTSSAAMKRLNEAVSINNSHLSIEAQRAEPSFCSEATYFVFLKTLILLEKRGVLSLTLPVITTLVSKNKPDGHGVWGRWNANGPGGARLFYQLKLGPNFTDLSAAEPGDFLKFFWSDKIGVSEHGHFVVYLGKEEKSGIEYINFWSSNQPNGYGKKSVPRARIHRMIFSRLTTPQGILSAPVLPEVDSYLASLLFRASSIEEIKKNCGLIEKPE